MIVGFCGYARVGKDTAAAAAKGFKRFAFADELKRDVAPLVLSRLGVDVFNCTDEEKDKIRPMLVAWGAVARAFDKDYWITRLEEDVEFFKWPTPAISDVRYANEVTWILNKGGIVYYIDRGYSAANEEEERSFAEIFSKFELPVIKNNGNVRALRATVQAATANLLKDSHAVL